MTRDSGHTPAHPTPPTAGHARGHAPSTTPRSAPRATGIATADSRPSQWVRVGIVAGLVGGGAIALLFLVIDVASGQPFRTPGVLGTLVFSGETTLRPGVAPEPAVVLAYTILHGVVFLAFGLIAAFVMEGRRSRLGPASALASAVVLFAAVEIWFLVFATIVGPRLLSELGLSAVTLANGLAAVAMTAVLMKPPARSLARLDRWIARSASREDRERTARAMSEQKG